MVKTMNEWKASQCFYQLLCSVFFRTDNHVNFIYRFDQDYYVAFMLRKTEVSKSQKPYFDLKHHLKIFAVLSKSNKHNRNVTYFPMINVT